MGEREATVGRSGQHAVHVVPHARFAMVRVLEPALDRIAPDADSTQLLVITPDGETAVSVADAARSIAAASAPIVAITGARRGTRLLSSRVLPAIAATPGTLVALVRSAAVKLDGVRTVIVAWADELIEAREGEALDVVLGEVPKDASRIVVTDRMSPEVEALVERHLRRASRQGVTEASPSLAPLPIHYVTTTSLGKPAAFRRLLDDLDPPSVIVLARDEKVADEARATVAALGYEGDANVRVVTEAVDEQAAVVVLYDLPDDASAIAGVATTQPGQVVALVTPRQVDALRRLTMGAVEPLDVGRAAIKARARDERLRASLRSELEGGFPAREVMALEPLLTEFDGLEIAAAALRILERERTEERSRRDAERVSDRAEPATERGGERGARQADAGARPKDAAAFTRVFLSIGERDGVRPGDLVGAITGESGITSDRIGKLDIRESFSVAEIAAADAQTVIDKMNGVTLKGRRLTARVDERPVARPREGAREGRSGPGGGARRGGFREGGRGSREAPRGFGDRPRDRGPRGPRRDDGGERRPRHDRDDRSEGRPRDEGRGSFRDRSDEGRVPRAARERDEWSERADRVRNARRPRRDDT